MTCCDKRATDSTVGQNVQESRAVARKPRDAAVVLFGLKFADDIHYKFKSSQASKARPSELQTYRHKTEFKVTCFGVSGKAIRHQVILYNKVGVIC